MKLLIKNAMIADPQSPYNGKKLDVFIEDGTIKHIGDGLSLSYQADQIIELNNLHLSPGWVDLFADFADPGFEQKETLETGAAAAAAGGFTDVFILPNTNPVVHNKAAVEYIVQKSKSFLVSLHPLGAVTTNAQGKELAEMYDMKASGAVAFTDGKNTIQSAGLLIKALQYLKAFDGTLIQLPDDHTIQPHGLMNEGIVSTQLGLPGKPAMAEELIVARDIELAAYAESKLHITAISTKKSVALIKEAKDRGVAVSCSVTPYHLFFCENDLNNYDTNLKLNPPLRTAEDRQALRQAFAEGLIDCIATHHFPQEADCKMVEFEYAKNGMIGLETAYAVMNTVLPGLPMDNWINHLSINPRKLFQLEQPTIAIGNKACITLFDPSKIWTMEEKHIFSKSKNTPFTGKTLSGKVVGIINKGNLILH